MFDDAILRGLLDQAAVAREMALLDNGKTKVGCSALAEDGRVFLGANMEHWLNFSDHAEKVAILTGLMQGVRKFSAFVICADRILFTPCGNCMDKIMQYGGPDCVIVHYNPRTKEIKKLTAKDIMPYYPTRDRPKQRTEERA